MPLTPALSKGEGAAHEASVMFLTCHSWFSFKYGVMKPEALLEQAAEKFAAFQPASTIHPNWGKEANERFLEMAK